MAIGLDYLLGKHQHTRIQHKDFATFLTGNVNLYFIQENLKANWKNAFNIYPLTSLPKSDVENGASKKIVYVRMLVTADYRQNRWNAQERLFARFSV